MSTKGLIIGLVVIGGIVALGFMAPVSPLGEKINQGISTYRANDKCARLVVENTKARIKINPRDLKTEICTFLKRSNNCSPSQKEAENWVITQVAKCVKKGGF